MHPANAEILQGMEMVSLTIPGLASSTLSPLASQDSTQPRVTPAGTADIEKKDTRPSKLEEAPEKNQPLLFIFVLTTTC